MEVRFNHAGLLFTLIAVGGLAASPRAARAAAYCPDITWHDSSGNRNAKNGLSFNDDYFDSNKETMIFIHGYQYEEPDDIYSIVPLPLHHANDSIPSDAPCGDNDSLCFSYEYFKSNGFNVAVFYWKDFIDTDMGNSGAVYTENWVWSNLGLFGCWDQNYVSLTWKYTNAADRFVEEYKDWDCSTQPSKACATIHIVAHSMGTQVALRALDKLADESGVVMPQYMTLLEPGWAGSRADDTADLFEDLMDDAAVTTNVVLGKSYVLTSLNPEYPFESEASTDAYRRMSNAGFDFWVDEDEDGVYPDPYHSNKYVRYWRWAYRHAKIVNYWFGDMVPLLFSDYGLIQLPGSLSYPFDARPQAGSNSWYWCDGHGVMKLYGCRVAKSRDDYMMYRGPNASSGYFESCQMDWQGMPDMGTCF